MKRFLSILFTAGALALEIFTKGAVGIYGPAPGTHVRVLYSYFSPTPFGYGMFPPMITGVLTVILLILGLIAVGNRKAQIAVCILAPVTFIVSLLPLLYGKTEGLWRYSLIGLAISLCLLVAAVFAIGAMVRKKPPRPAGPPPGGNPPPPPPPPRSKE